MAERSIPVTIRLTPDELDFVDEAARRETRTRAGQVVHWVRRGGAMDGYCPDVTVGRPEPEATTDR